MSDRATSRVATPHRVGRPGRGGTLATLLAIGLSGGALAGCALSVPMNTVAGEEVPTGSIRKAAGLSPFSAEMDAEDWRRAKSALETALDPQGNGASVAWDNPKSGAKGSFVPLAQPYPKDDGICRPFTAHLVLKGTPETIVTSSACRVNSGDWIVGRITPAVSGHPAAAKRDPARS